MDIGRHPPSATFRAVESLPRLYWDFLADAELAEELGFSHV
jgi:hypothetical protein